MRVLIACETSGVVRREFQAKGHDVYSCDILPAEDGETARHFREDVLDVMERGDWDLIVMHPPCTALATSGNRWYAKGKPKHSERLAAIEWTMALWTRATSICPRVAMENPVGVLPMAPTQYIHPWEHGHGEVKRTGLWLHGLPALTPSDVVEGRDPRVWRMGPSPDRWRDRSRTYAGIAHAMASQWAGRVGG